MQPLNLNSSDIEFMCLLCSQFHRSLFPVPIGSLWIWITMCCPLQSWQGNINIVDHTNFSFSPFAYIFYLVHSMFIGVCCCIRRYGLTYFWSFTFCSSFDGSKFQENTCYGIWSCESKQCCVRLEIYYRLVYTSPNFMLQILEELEFTMDQFIDLCILCGCDYCDSIKGIIAHSFLFVWCSLHFSNYVASQNFKFSNCVYVLVH